MPRKTKLSPEVKTNLPILLMKNSKTSISEENQTAKTTHQTYSNPPPNQLDPSIGSLKEMSNTLKTKDNVDLVGLSQLLLPLNLLMLFSDLNSVISPNKNSSIVALDHAMDVVEEK